MGLFGPSKKELELQRQVDELNQRVSNLMFVNKNLQSQLTALGFTEYEQTKKAIDANNAEIAQGNITINKLREEITSLNEELEKKNKSLKTSTNKIAKSKEIYKSVDYAINNFFNSDVDFNACKIPTILESDLEELSPSVILKLNCMNVPDLKKAYRENEKRIQDVLKAYEGRYTTKANKTIYRLMVIALKAELQNILIDLKYEKLDNAIEILKSTTAKYLAIASEGNQSIAGTITKFIGEIEYLFINAIKIEYNYYVKREQARQEQLAIKEQMKQEAEERKALELEKKKIEAEELKYNNEINSINEKLSSATDESEIEKLKARILELQSQLSDVIIKKDEIVNLQNGKAGTVYIISNLGSFGENVFKVGMTRRLDPQDRINELGNASVPFKFDVHSFIFSDDAVSLELEMHTKLNERRVNKVNRRKEFFNITIDELEELVHSIDPTAEFNKTMIAEEFRQSISSDTVYEDTFELEEIEDE